MDTPADSSNPPSSGANPDEPDTSQMKAVPARPDVVWPEDPFESDGRAADEEAGSEAQVTSPPIPAWPESQFGAPSMPPGRQHVAPLEDDPHTTPFPTQAAVGKTQPPAVAKTVPPAQDNGAEETRPPIPTTEVADTAPPAPAADVLETVPPASGTEPALHAVTETEPEASEPAQAADAEPAVAMADEPEQAGEQAEPEEAKETMAAEEPEAEPVYEAEPASEPEVPAVAMTEGAPAEAAVEGAEPAEPAGIEAQPEPEPAPAPEPAPEPAPQKAATMPSEEERLAAEAAEAFAASSSKPPAANPAVPSWAPKFDAPQPADQQVQWPGSNLPSWAPIASGRPTTEPQAVRVTSTPAPAPAQASQPAAPAPARPAQPTPPAAAPAGSRPPAPASGASTPPKSSSWEIVPPKVDAQPVSQGPTAEDKSYAEWFAWAKRSGAPASACHAAAQGAFRALSGGQDMATAVKWATVAMASPPGLVGQARQLYCAWFSLGNIDLQLPTPQAHAFATAAIQALDSGADSMVAHQIGLQAAGITPR